MKASGISLRQSFALFKDKRLLAIFILGCCSGLPWVLIGSSMSAWLQESGLSRSAIGYFGSVFAVYAINWMWAPLVDRINIPLFSRLLGHRKSWVVCCMSGISLCCAAIGLTNPENSLLWTSLLAFCIALLSATQDIAIDAYRIEIIGEDDSDSIPHAASMATSGWWAGYSLIGAMAFYLSDADSLGWQHVYLFLAASVAVLLGIVCFLNEPDTDRVAQQQQAELRYQKQLDQQLGHGIINRLSSWLMVSVVEPFVDFFKRNGLQIGLLVLSFIFLFKIGEAFLGRMSIVFYKEIGFSNSDIATYSKLIGGWLTIAFAITGGIINTRLGIIKGLFIGGLAMASSNLMFAWLASTGPDPQLFAAAVVVDGFTSAFATVTFVAFISYLTGHTYTATQYALMASLGNLGRTTLSAFSGELVDYLQGDWSLFFVLTALMVIPSLLLLCWIAYLIHKKEQQAL